MWWQDNFSVQVLGRKEWTLIPPHHGPSLQTKPVTPFLHAAGVAPTEEHHSITLILEPAEALYIPAGWFHSTVTLPTAPQDVSRAGPGLQPSATVNFFASACFGSLGVIVPKLANSAAMENWVPGFEPATWHGP